MGSGHFSGESLSFSDSDFSNSRRSSCRVLSSFSQACFSCCFSCSDISLLGVAIIFLMLEILSSMDCFFCSGVGWGGVGLLNCVVEVRLPGEMGIREELSGFDGEGISVVVGMISGVVVSEGIEGSVMDMDVWRFWGILPASLFSRDFVSWTGTKISLFFLSSLYKTMLPSLISWMVRCPIFSPCRSHLFPSDTVLNIASDFSGELS